MVHFHSISHVSHTASIALKFVGHKADFVPTLNQALSQLVAVCLHSSKFGEGEVGADEDAVLSVGPGSSVMT